MFTKKTHIITDLGSFDHTERLLKIKNNVRNKIIELCVNITSATVKQIILGWKKNQIQLFMMSKKKAESKQDFSLEFFFLTFFVTE